MSNLLKIKSSYLILINITVTIRRFVLYLHVGIHFFARILQTNYWYVNLIHSVQCFHFEVSFVAMFK